MTALSLLTESLQRAVIERLGTDTVLGAAVSGVFDYVPPEATFPYIVVQMNAWHNRSAGYNAGISEHVFALEVWSDYDGNAELFDVMQRVESLLLWHSLNLTVGEMVNLTLRKSETAHVEERRRRGHMSYTAIIHDA